MKGSFSAVALAATVFASSAVAQMYQSPPFNLILLSKNSTLNGSALLACHEGAAIEGLCPMTSTKSNPGSTLSTYAFNTTSELPAEEEEGILTYELRGSNFNVSSAMELAVNPVSNVAVPLFSPSDDQFTYVAFDATGKLNIKGYIDDTKVPLVLNQVKPYHRFWVCETYYGYRYQTLAWVWGNAQPQNPTCQKVEVVRVFV